MYKEQIKYLRELNEVTQEELSNAIGIIRGSYSHYETENNIIPIKHLNSICNYFNVSLDYIFGFTKTFNYSKTNKNIDNIISGTRLKEFRKENNLTQSKLASILNTVHPVITNYEKGKNIIATPFLYTICKKYNISADYLLGKTDNPKYFK